MEDQALVQPLRHALDASGEDVVCAYLFGSMARGEASENSDIDVGILFASPRPKTLEGLGSELEDRLSETIGRPVDMVVLNHAPPDLIHRVLRDGCLIMDNDSSARIRFEVKARNDYFDILPVLKQYRKGRTAA